MLAKHPSLKGVNMKRRNKSVSIDNWQFNRTRFLSRINNVWSRADINNGQRVVATVCLKGTLAINFGAKNPDGEEAEYRICVVKDIGKSFQIPDNYYITTLICSDEVAKLHADLKLIEFGFNLKLFNGGLEDV